MSAQPAPEWEGLTSDLSEPGCESSGNARPTQSAECDSAGTGPTSPVTPTSGPSPMKYQPLKKLVPEQVDEAIRLYLAGYSLAKIRARMGVSRQAMHDLLKRRIPLRDRVAALPRKDPAQVKHTNRAARDRYRQRAARITRGQERSVRERDQVCTLCRAEGEEIDHIIPVSRGGETTMENLQLLCRPCHVEKTRAERKGVMLRSEVATSSPSRSGPCVGEAAISDSTRPSVTRSSPRPSPQRDTMPARTALGGRRSLGVN